MNTVKAGDYYPLIREFCVYVGLQEVICWLFCVSGIGSFAVICIGSDGVTLLNVVTVSRKG